MWDSLPSGFTSYTLGGYGSGSTLLALGGGYAGTGLSYIYINSGSYAFGNSLDRSFDGSGLQTNVSASLYWLDSNYTLPWTSAGYLIEGRGTNMTGVIYQRGAQKIEVCPPAGAPILKARRHPCRIPARVFPSRDNGKLSARWEMASCLKAYLFCRCEKSRPQCRLFLEEMIWNDVMRNRSDA